MIKGINADWYFLTEDKWQSSKLILRDLALSAGLTETLSYGKPTYCIESGKLFLIHTFKDYIAILFFKGVLMDDPKNLLIQQTPNVQTGRQLRFVDVNNIEAMKGIIVDYIEESKKVELSGKKITLKKTSDYTFPLELQKYLDNDSKLAEAFASLTPGRQRGYLLYIESAKQSKTREQRITQSIPYILKGKGRSKSGGFEE
jgi:uncharacterized protein YdeI (YjbR/CyaY-like superfamily)